MLKISMFFRNASIMGRTQSSDYPKEFDWEMLCDEVGLQFEVISQFSKSDLARLGTTRVALAEKALEHLRRYDESNPI